MSVKKEIKAYRLRGAGDLPAYLCLGHRQLEKSGAQPIMTLTRGTKKELTYRIAVDSMRTCGMIPGYIDEVDSIEVVYLK